MARRRATSRRGASGKSTGCARCRHPTTRQARPARRPFVDRRERGSLAPDVLRCSSSTSRGAETGKASQVPRRAVPPWTGRSVGAPREAKAAREHGRTEARGGRVRKTSPRDRGPLRLRRCGRGRASRLASGRARATRPPRRASVRDRQPKGGSAEVSGAHADRPPVGFGDPACNGQAEPRAAGRTPSRALLVAIEDRGAFRLRDAGSRIRDLENDERAVIGSLLARHANANLAASGGELERIGDEVVDGLAELWRVRKYALHEHALERKRDAPARCQGGEE